ncbi:MAG TPA: MFS transporter, partial [Candidatus Eisenbacteria bacterium]|nr:MFS transporter [Candidatus Eisenbacteria bacterium]
GPLGAILMPALSISTRQFGLAVSAYAFAAGLSGILAAGFADGFDRKKLLLFFYGGFIVGTFLCGVAPSYGFIVLARIVTGGFGGVIGSISMAIIADVFPIGVRGRVMGFVQAAFGASQVLGLPLGLWLGNHLGWHAPFLMIVALSTCGGAVILAKLRPVTAHLEAQVTRSPLAHLFKTVGQGRYLLVFLATIFMTTGGFMLMPFASAFSVNNLKIDLDHLPWVYLVAGLSSFAAGPLLGRLSDGVGKYRLFSIGSFVSIAMVLVYCRLGETPLAWVIAINVLLYGAIGARMISSQALISAVPELAERGAFMAANGSVAQLSGGVAAGMAGLIVVQRPGQPLEHYDVLGWLVTIAGLVTLGLLYPIQKMVSAKMAQGGPDSRLGGSAPSGSDARAHVSAR